MVTIIWSWPVRIICMDCLHCVLLQVHVMPRELFGRSTFGLSTQLLRVFPVWFVDKLLVFFSWLTLGGTAKYHLVRPEEGPLSMKARTGKTPVLDVGTVAKIRSGEIKVHTYHSTSLKIARISGDWYCCSLNFFDFISGCWILICDAHEFMKMYWFMMVGWTGLDMIDDDYT